MALRIGLDIGATKTNLLILEADGKVRARRKMLTESIGSADPIIEKIGSSVEQMLSAERIPRSQIEACGVGLAGQLDPLTGVVDHSPNLRWNNVQFRKPLEALLSMNVYLTNDVNAAAWGEFCFGAGRKSRDMAEVLVGSGIGGGLVCNGRLVEGTSGTAGEVGHLVFKENGLKCDCGNRGCFEVYAGGMPLENRMRKAVQQGRSKMVQKMVGGKLEKINTRVIHDAALKGDKVAKKIWAEAETALGILCANLISLLNPDRIVVGGGVVDGNPELMETITRIALSRSVHLSGTRVQIVRSALAGDAVAMGAAAVADLYR